MRGNLVLGLMVLILLLVAAGIGATLDWRSPPSPRPALLLTVVSGHIFIHSVASGETCRRVAADIERRRPQNQLGFGDSWCEEE